MKQISPHSSAATENGLGVKTAERNGIQPASDATSNRQVNALMLALVLLLTGGICTTGWFYFKRQQDNALRTVNDTLATIADLKAGQIAGWMKERRGTAETALNKPAARQFLAEPDNATLREEMLAWMTACQRVYDLVAVMLVDSRGVIRLSVPADAPPLEGACVEHVQTALHARDVVFVDLHGDQNNQPHLAFLIPIGIKPQEGQPADGVLVFEVDPHRFLYPLVQNWPTASPTAETLLVRRDGNEVLYLNELRHRKNTALVTRMPIDSTSRLPSSMAVEGKEGIMEGVDYRGVPTVAALRKIPGTPWFMVAKVDQAEIFTPLRQEAWGIGLIVGLLLLATLLGVGLLWRQQKLLFARRELAMQKQREQEVHRLNAELEQRVRDRTAELRASNQELEAFSYSVSHDLRAPLRHLTGFAELLQKNDRANLDDKARRHLAFISESALRMGQLIDDLLAFSRAGRAEVHKAPLNLAELVRESIQGLQPDTQGRRIVWEIAPLPVIDADANLLRAVLTNLFANAIKFTRSRDEARIEMGWAENERENIFFIRDNGVGFDMQYVEKLFGVFQRLHTTEQFEGTGIGLANVRRIISRHGGRTWAESVLNEGSTFYFSLPKTNETMNSERKAI